MNQPRETDDEATTPVGENTLSLDALLPVLAAGGVLLALSGPASPLRKITRLGVAFAAGYGAYSAAQSLGLLGDKGASDAPRPLADKDVKAAAQRLADAWGTEVHPPPHREA